MQARNRPMISKHVNIATFLPSAPRNLILLRENKAVRSKNKEAMTSKSRLLLVWAGCPPEEPSTKCGIKESLPRRKDTLSQAHCSESSILRHSWPIKCSFPWPWPILGRELRMGCGVRSQHACSWMKWLVYLENSVEQVSNQLVVPWSQEFLLSYLSQDPEKILIYSSIFIQQISLIENYMPE